MLLGLWLEGEGSFDQKIRVGKTLATCTLGEAARLNFAFRLYSASVLASDFGSLGFVFYVFFGFVTVTGNMCRGEVAFAVLSTLDKRQNVIRFPGF